MADEQKIVPQEQASTTEQVSTTTTETKKEETKVEPQPLTKEAIEQMIAEATAKAVNEAKEVGKRELQSAQDRNRAELAKQERREKLAERGRDAAQTHLRSVDPDAADKAELAALRAERDGQTSVEQEEQMAQYKAEAFRKFDGQMTQFVTNLGIDPKDKRLDWAEDETNELLVRQQRILDSAAKIQKDNIQIMKATQENLDKRLKELEKTKKAEEKEANSVETTTSQGVVTGSDAEFLKGFANGTLPLTKVNVERRNKILEQS